MQCCVSVLLKKLRLNTYAEGSELCTGEENGYKITEFSETPRPSQAGSSLSGFE